ncbi:MAG TPA: ATP-binding cassette domain-containing protein [Verrucomicrobiae bacterium]|nr:ATP-binding cassette domain-containing protein [Verrucomicrobiae bacterium]
MPTSTTAISVEGLTKAFGENKVLTDINFSVERGSVFALLGPNGAGKTTAVRIMTTLLQADSGKVVIDGVTVSENPDAIRSMIGLTGQNAAVDEKLTGLANLQMIGKLYHLSTADANLRAQELIEQFELVDAANRPAKTYSGGMRRRLDLAASLIVSPPILFLDEPTTGLDPHSRNTMWNIIRELVSKGTTLLLTTQYLEEADQLADHIAVIDHGTVIAQGTATELKRSLGGDRLEVAFATPEDLEKAMKALKKYSPLAKPEQCELTVEVKKGFDQLAEVIAALKAEGIKVERTTLHEPTLDDVFLTLTGHKTEIAA